MDTTIDFTAILSAHKQWRLDNNTGKRANLRGADLRGANLRGADLSGANLRDADLSDADLSDADLRGANLRRITLCNATIDGAILGKGNIGGPGYILCALTDDEWNTIKQGRNNKC